MRLRPRKREKKRWRVNECVCNLDKYLLVSLGTVFDRREREHECI